MVANFLTSILKCIFLNENVSISIKISLFFPKVPINNIPVLVQIMARDGLLNDINKYVH